MLDRASALPPMFLLVISIVLVVIYIIWLIRNPQSEEPNLAGYHVLITGGSSGIGMALAAEALSRSPARLTLVARNPERLAEVRNTLLQAHSSAGTDIRTISLDITAPYEEIRKALVETHKVGVVDVLINCAGTAVARTFEDAEPQIYEDLIKVNYLGAVNVTKALLPSMLRPGPVANSRGEGNKVIYPHERRIAFFSSPAAQITVYGYSAYSAAKAALSSFANTIQQELEDDGIKVTIVYPPDTDTPGFTAENVGKPKVTRLISETSGLETAATVAGRSMHYILVGWRNCAFGPLGRALLWLTAGVSRAQEDSNCPFMLPFPPILVAAIEVLMSPLLKVGSLGFAYWMRSCIVKYRGK
ncbi:hypothetical protein Aperf_G00000102666 [Anoplocephala perfoliata]